MLSGILPVWKSEIEPFPIAVTEKRLPFVKHLGDINCINGAEIEPVDIITFGSPCTDLSVAGKRQGLNAARSGLFFQAVRIIKEMGAIGLRQLDRYKGLLERRTEIIKSYDAVCDELGITYLVHHTDTVDSSNHLYLTRIPGITEAQRNELIVKLAEAGVTTNVHYKPLPMMTAYGRDCSDYPNAYDYSRVILKKHIDLNNPKTFNEKIQWLKIHDFSKNPLVIRGADKYAVRKYVKKKGLGHILVPLIGAWRSADEIEWEKLPNRFVLKCNHGCAYNILCPDKKKFDIESAVRQLNKWMKEDFGAYNIELHYSKIKPHMITCEEYLGEKIIDYKFFCFNGKPKYMYVSSDLVHDRQAQIGFFYLDGKKMPLIRDDYAPMDLDELPPFFEDMQKSMA